MNKKVFILAIMLLSLVGCGSKTTGADKTVKQLKTGTIVCTKTEKDEDGYNQDDKVTINYKNNKATILDSTSSMEVDPEYLDFTYLVLNGMVAELDKVDGISASAKKSDNKIVMDMKIDYDNVDVDKLKEAFGELADESELDMYSKGNASIEELKQEYLDNGYSCN